MTDWYPGLAGVIDKGFGGSRGGDPINGAVIHHTANGGGTSALNYVANANSRNSHPTYLIQSSGAAYGIVHPNRRPYSTGGRPDSEAVAFEVDNSGGAPNWPTSAAAKETLAQMIAYHYRHSPRWGHGIVRNIPGRAQPEFFVAWHSQYVATTCPGADMLAHLDAVIARAMEIAHPAAPPVEPPPAPVRFKVVFDDSPDDPSSDYAVIEVDKGSRVNRPAVDPVRPGFEFLDWYDLNGSEVKPYDFGKPVSGLLTLVARYEAVVSAPEPEPIDPADLDEIDLDEIEDNTGEALGGDAGNTRAPLSGLFAGNDRGRKRAYLIYASAALLVSFVPDVVVYGVLTSEVEPVIVAWAGLSSSLLLKIGTALGFVAAANTSR